MSAMLTEVIDGLNSFKGIWPKIARESGVGYTTVQKIAQGERTNPNLKTITALHGWLASHGGIVEQPAPHAGPDRRKKAA